jgi:hypothetical protein
LSPSAVVATLSDSNTSGELTWVQVSPEFLEL